MSAVSRLVVVNFVLPDMIARALAGMPARRATAWADGQVKAAARDKLEPTGKSSISVEKHYNSAGCSDQGSGQVPDKDEVSRGGARVAVFAEIALTDRALTRVGYEVKSMRVLSASVLGWPMAVLVVFIALTSPAAAGVVFGVDNFNGGVLSNWSSGSFTLGIDTTPSGQNFLGIGGDGSNFGLTNGSVTLSVPTAAVHTSATVQFRLYVIRSMDGSELFSVSADGTDRINPDALFSNLGSSSCTDAVSAGCTGIGASNAPPGTVGPVVAELDFPPLNCCAVGDTYYDLTLTFPHSATSLALVFSYSGLQDLNDESWGLDNVTVQTNGTTEPPPPGVPAPAALWLLCLGAVGLAVATRNLRSQRHSS